MSETLKEMGMPLAFGKADFSGISPELDLNISEVYHKTFIKVDEKGTEAAAATAVVVSVRGRTAPPETFTADHPFLFLICHQQTKEVLFMGRLVTPG